MYVTFLRSMLVWVGFGVSMFVTIHAMDAVVKDEGLEKAKTLIVDLYATDNLIKNPKSADYIAQDFVVEMLEKHWEHIKKQPLSSITSLDPTKESIKNFIRFCSVKHKEYGLNDKLNNQKLYCYGLTASIIGSFIMLGGVNTWIYLGLYC